MNKNTCPHCGDEREKKVLDQFHRDPIMKRYLFKEFVDCAACNNQYYRFLNKGDDIVYFQNEHGERI